MFRRIVMLKKEIAQEDSATKKTFDVMFQRTEFRIHNFPLVSS